MIETSITICVPGSTSNLGPGFDTLGLSLSIYVRLTFDLLDKDDRAHPLISLKGEIASHLAPDQSNLIYKVLSHILADQQDLLKRIRITIDSEIPLARGLGSSGAATLGAVYAGYALSNQPLDRNRILSDATRIEGHPDNLAASLFGNLVVCSQTEGGDVFTERLEWPDDWSTLVVVPSYVLSTAHARSVLPRQVDLSDAVSNLQHLGLLIASVNNRDEEGLRHALYDRLHEPYREVLVPELVQLRKGLKDLPVLGCVLSGAGPSVLVLLNSKHKPEVFEHLKSWSSSNGHEHQYRILDLKVDQKGLREEK